MNTWVFQGNPDVFDISGYLSASPGEIRWLVTRYADEMNVGDTVYLLQAAGKSKDTAGIVAEGTLLEQPHDQIDDTLSSNFWKQADETQLACRVCIRLQRVANKKEILKRDWLHEDSILKEFPVFKMAAATNFRVTEPQAQRLRRLWDRTGVPFSRAEIVASLLLYETTRGQVLSKSPGAAIEQMAQKVGRATSGIYNKLMNFRALDPRAKQAGPSGGSKLDTEVWDSYFDTQASTLNLTDLQREYERLWGNVDAPARGQLQRRHPADQLGHLDGATHVERTAVLCAVRARGHGRTHPRQDCRRQAQGDVDGRRAAPGLRRRQPSAGAVAPRIKTRYLNS